MAALSAWFWNERFWLPHNVTWADLADPAPGVEYPKAGHLLNALPLALGIFAVRILFERFVLAAHVGSFVVSEGKFPPRPPFNGFFSNVIDNGNRKTTFTHLLTLTQTLISIPTDLIQCLHWCIQIASGIIVKAVMAVRLAFSMIPICFLFLNPDKPVMEVMFCAVSLNIITWI